MTGKYKKIHLYVLTNLSGYITVRCRREADATGELNLQLKKKGGGQEIIILSFHMIEVAYGNMC